MIGYRHLRECLFLRDLRQKQPFCVMQNDAAPKATYIKMTFHDIYPPREIIVRDYSRRASNRRTLGYNSRLVSREITTYRTILLLMQYVALGRHT